MTDIVSLAQEHKDLPEREQKQAGQAIAGAMGDAHVDFLKQVVGLIQNGEIDYHVPETFLHKDIYGALSEIDRAQVDVSMVNIADFLRHITEFYLSKKTPDESPHLQTMIEQLWEMKERVEGKYGDVFKF